MLSTSRCCLSISSLFSLCNGAQPIVCAFNFIERTCAHTCKTGNGVHLTLATHTSCSFLHSRTSYSTKEKKKNKKNVQNVFSIFLMSFSFHLDCRILDSMKVPGQRSSFHICDILDLNPTDSKNTNNNNNNNTTNNNSNENANTNTTFASHTNTTSTSSRDDGASAITVHPPPPIPPPPYPLPASFNSAIYSELGHHYHSMFPSATKSWLKDHHEQYGKSRKTEKKY